MANEGFWTSAGSFDAAEMRRYNAAFVDNTTPGGVMWGMLPRMSGTQVVVDPGACAIADGSGGVYIIRLASATTGLNPPTTPNTYIIYIQEQDPGSGATAGEPTYGFATSLSGLSLAIPLGAITIATGGVQTLNPTGGGRRTAKIKAPADGGDAATLGGSTAANLSVGTAARADTLKQGAGYVDVASLNVATAGSATNAQKSEYISNDVAYMRLHYADQRTQPGYIWGTAGDANHSYLYSPSFIKVGGATAADNGTSNGQRAIPQEGASVQGSYDFVNTTPISFPNVNSGTGTTMIRTAGGALRPTSSSRRFKKEIVDLPISVEALRTLRPVQFEYDPDAEGIEDVVEGELHAGFIAEEVEEAFPEAVVHSDGKVQDVEVRALLAGAYRLIQDLYEKIDDLEARLA